MNGARDQLFASAGFAGDQNSGIGGCDLLDDFERVFEFSGVGENFLEPGSLAELFAERNIFGFESLAKLADFFVGKSVGGGDGKSARNVFEDGFLVRREGALLEADEGGNAEDLPAHDERNCGVGADAVFGEMMFVAEPAVLFEEVIAGVRLAGNFVFLAVFRVWEQRARFGERWRLRVTFGASGELLGSFTVDRSDANDMESEETMEVAVFVGRVVGDGEVDDTDGIEGDERDEDVGEGSEDAGEFALGADGFPGAEHEAEAVGAGGGRVGLENGVGHWRRIGA